MNQLSPSPIFYAGLSAASPDAHIGVLGSDLPLHNPVQLAEEYSMLDNLLAVDSRSVCFGARRTST